MIETQQAQAEYVRSVAGAGSASTEIERGQALLASGAITQAEFESLKAKALA
jgi:multidrug resistance efflux pump